MSKPSAVDDEMPAEIDFSTGIRGLHYIAPGTQVFLPTAIEQSVWEHYSKQAANAGISLPELLTEILKSDINQAPSK
jgi:hypothetical protein